MKRSLVACAIALVLPAGLLPASPATAKKRSLRDEPFTVVAVVDSGIDPYHLDFRRPELTAHPSTYVEGFPKDAPALDLTFDEKIYANALRADRKTWRNVKRNKLYWIPGTNIVGAIGPFDMHVPIGFEDSVFPPEEEPPILDQVGHGTAVASLAGGAIHGPGTDRTLIVAIQGFEEALDWAARQPWIDVITNSWFNFEADNYSAGAKASREAVRSGKVVCFASGNFSHPQLYTGTQGPPWTVNVGAASAKTRGEHYYTNYPNDVLGLSGVQAAGHQSFSDETEFAGTSAAAPSVCGLIGKTISEVRDLLKTGLQGATPKSLASGRRLAGFLEDGKLSRLELEDAIQSTAVPAEPSADTSDPNSMPAAPGVPFLRGGYGIVDGKSARAALDVIVGRKPRPDRTVEDAWSQAIDAIRDAIWSNLP